jgi:hypothetical protein
MVNEEEIEILLNICYGGWNISKKAIELYKLRSPSYNVTENYFDYYLNRHDSILVQIYKELGDNFDGKHSKTKIKKILKKYENYYDIDEYDGKECVRITPTKKKNETKRSYHLYIL